MIHSFSSFEKRDNALTKSEDEAETVKSIGYCRKEKKINIDSLSLDSDNENSCQIVENSIADISSKNSIRDDYCTNQSDYVQRVETIQNSFNPIFNSHPENISHNTNSVLTMTREKEKSDIKLLSTKMKI